MVVEGRVCIVSYVSLTSVLVFCRDRVRAAVHCRYVDSETYCCWQCVSEEEHVVFLLLQYVLRSGKNQVGRLNISDQIVVPSTLHIFT